MTPSLPPPRPLHVTLALATVYLVWGSTYFAVRLVVQDLPPLLTAGVRFTIAGALLYAALRLTGTPAPSGRSWRAALPVAVPMFLLAHGTLAWALQQAPSGTGALFAALSPAWMLLVGLATGGARPDRRTVLGLGAGFLGVAALMDPGAMLAGQGLDLLVALAMLLSSVGWGVGSVLSRRPELAAMSPFQTSAMAMGLGGALLLTSSAAAGELRGFDLGAVPGGAWLGLAYLVVVGSLVAFSAYVWLLRRDGPARASTHAFVNPVIAVGLGAAVGGEVFTGATALGMVLVLAAVALIGHRAEGPHRPEVVLKAAEPARSRRWTAALRALATGTRVSR